MYEVFTYRMLPAFFFLGILKNLKNEFKLLLVQFLYRIYDQFNNCVLINNEDFFSQFPNVFLFSTLGVDTAIDQAGY